MYDWIYKNLNYPYTAQERGIQGRVWVRFIVPKTGKAEDVRILRGLDKACDTEAVRVIKAMPDWTPGQEKGEAVPVFYTVRIDFKASTI